MRFGRWIVACSLLLISVAAAAKNPPYPMGSIDELFPQPPKPVEYSYKIDDRTIHYWQIGNGPA
uniref:hypothetical protein n=1 Tax=uncultured Nevskia sp. TaxID=228950 RepID=UPI0025CFD584